MAVPLLLGLLFTSILASLIFGAQKLTPGTEFSKIIFLNIRLPRTILVLLAGSLLAGSGTVFQMYFRNPLAEPGIMGISSGATLGAVIAAAIISKATASVASSAGIFSTQNTFFLFRLTSPVNIGAFIGSLAAGLLVTFISLRSPQKSATISLLLAGTALGTLYSALTSILLSTNDKTLHAMYNWMIGSFSGRGWRELTFIALPSLLCIVLLVLSAPKLDLLTLGETTAITLGVDARRLRTIVIIAGALGTSAAVCAGGTIGFVGLIAPHAARKIFGSKARILLPTSMATGSILLLISDTVCRTAIAPAEIPVGTVTAILGVPFFLSLLFTRGGIKNGN